MANTTKPIIDANALEAMAKERPNEKFLKGSGVLKLIQAIRDLERANRQLQAEQPIQIKDLRKALQFYADGHHFTKSDGDAWDTVSGEPQNYWCDEAGTATVEDGSIAKLALAGHPIKFEDEDATAQPAAPQCVAYAELDDAFESWLEDQDVDRLSDGYESWLNSVRSCWDSALRASHGQAPAGAADEMEINRPFEDPAPPFNQWRGEMQSALKRAGVYAARSPGAGNKLTLRWRTTREDVLPTPTAQAAPAAGAVAGSAEPTQEMIAAVLRLVDLGQSDPEDHRYDDGSKLATQICRAVLAAAPTTAAQADSQPAPQGETNVQLDIDSNHSAPEQHRDMAGSVALGQPMGNGQDQAAGHSGAQGDKLLTVAERNIRSFLRSAVFKSESDREAALSCVDVLRDAARAPADSVLEDAARGYELVGYINRGIEYHNKGKTIFHIKPTQNLKARWWTPDIAVYAARKQGGA